MGSGEDSLLGLDFSVSPHRRRGREFLGVPFIRALTPQKAPPVTKSPPKGPSTNTTLGINISAHEFGGDTNIQSTAVTEV